MTASLRTVQDKHSRSGKWDVFDGSDHIGVVFQEPIPFQGNDVSFTAWSAKAGNIRARFTSVEDAAEAVRPAKPRSAGSSYTVIYTGGAEPIVHLTGCSHNLRDSLRGTHQTQQIIGTLADVAAHVMSDFIEDGDDPADYISELKVKACAR